MKVQRISEFQHEFSFLSPTENFERYYEGFLESDLGKIYQALPWDDMVKTFGLTESRKGPKPIFSPQGKIASGCSYVRLLEQLNGNVAFQFFCDLSIGLHRLRNSKIISEIRCDLASKLDTETLERVLSNHWEEEIHHQKKDGRRGHLL